VNRAGGGSLAIEYEESLAIDILIGIYNQWSCQDHEVNEICPGNQIRMEISSIGYTSVPAAPGPGGSDDCTSSPNVTLLSAYTVAYQPVRRSSRRTRHVPAAIQVLLSAIQHRKINPASRGLISGTMAHVSDLISFASLSLSVSAQDRGWHLETWSNLFFRPTLQSNMVSGVSPWRVPVSSDRLPHPPLPRTPLPLRQSRLPPKRPSR
jgi:hypothetical protein